MPPSKSDLDAKVDALFAEPFAETAVSDVPDISDKRLTHGGTGLSGEFTFLYTDMRGSSDLSDAHRRQTIAKIYKAFHHCMVETIKAKDGRVRSFDGDRVMGIFAGNRQTNNAVEAAKLMVGALMDVLCPRITARYKNNSFEIGIGIARGEALATKAGVGYDQNNRDLVWIGDAPNLGAKLSDEAAAPVRILVCDTTFGRLADEKRWTTRNGVKTDMWARQTITFKSSVRTVYGSHWYTPLS